MKSSSARDGRRKQAADRTYLTLDAAQGDLSLHRSHFCRRPIPILSIDDDFAARSREFCEFYFQDLGLACESPDETRTRQPPAGGSRGVGVILPFRFDRTVASERFSHRGQAMFRKMLIAAGAVTLVSGVSALTPLGSYARCGWDWLTTSASDAVPLEWELKRARQMIADLEPEIARHSKQIVRERIELAKLQDQAAKTEAALQKSESEVKRLAADLERGEASYHYAGKEYTPVQVRDDLAGRFARFKTRSETSSRLSQMVRAREASVRTAGERLETMVEAKNQLEVEVENLQARLESLRLAQTGSQLNLDDSHLARTRGLLDELSSRLEVEEEVATAEITPPGAIDLDAPASSKDLLEEIAQRFRQDEAQDRVTMIPIEVE